MIGSIAFREIIPSPLSDCAVLKTGGRYVLSADVQLEQGEDACIAINADGVSLDCLEHSLTGLGGSSSKGILADGSNYVEVKNCFITRFGDGIRARSSSNVLLDNNTLFRNYHGILFHGTTRSNLTNSRVMNSTACNAVLLEGSSRNLVEGNTMAYSTWGCSITIANGSNQNTIAENRLYRNYRSGIRVEDSSRNLLTRNTACWNGAAFRDLNCTSAQIDGGGNACGTQAGCLINCTACRA